MTEPGYIQPPPPGWWERKDRIGTAETGITVNTTTDGTTIPVELWRPLRGAHQRAGSMAMRRNFKRRPGGRTKVFGPRFDAGSSATGSNSTSWTWSHTIAADANYLVVVSNHANASMPTPVLTGTCGGVAMTQLTSTFAFTTGGFNFYVGAMGILNPPTGSQTIILNSSAGGSTYAHGLSYKNVTSVGSVITGNNTLAAPSNGNQTVVNAFCGYTTTYTAYSRTQRFNDPFSPGYTLVVGEAPGASNLTFAVTGGTSVGVAIPLNG